MSNFRPLTVQSGVTTQQKDADNLIVGAGVVGVAGAISANTHKVTNVVDPVAAQDAVTLNFLGVRTATWTGTRYFAVDYDGGNDANAGFSDSSMSAAGAVAIKTLEHLKAIFPRNGNGQIAVVCVKARASGATYRNAANSADDYLDFAGVFGYQQLVVRGTATQATASSTAFANDAADKVFCGAQVMSGTNTAGYNPTGSPSASSFTCQLAGGGAAALTAEPALVGKRIRFDSATATTALRNICSMIWQNDSSTITVAQNLPATPSTSDVFYIEEPATAVAVVDFGGSDNGFTAARPTSLAVSGIMVAGFKAVATGSAVVNFKTSAALLNASFIDIPNSTSYSALLATGPDVRMQNTYTDETAAPVTITPGVGVRSNGGITPTLCYNLTCTHSVTIAGRFQFLNIATFSVGGGCYGQQGALLQGCGGSGTATTNVSGATLGNSASTAQRRFRSVGPGPSTDVIGISRSNVWINGCDLTGAGSQPLIRLNGVSISINVNDVVGSTGNTGLGIDLSVARDARILLGTLAANTFTGAAGHDIGASSTGPFYVHADYARTDLRDQNGNHIQGSAGSFLAHPLLSTNDAGADIGQYAIVKASGSGTTKKAKADTAANAGGVVGVSQSAYTAAGPQTAMIAAGGAIWVQFDSAPTAGDLAYLSTATAGNAQNTAPALSGTNQKLRLGRVISVSGSLGLVAWFPDVIPVTADGLA